MPADWPSRRGSNVANYEYVCGMHLARRGSDGHRQRRAAPASQNSRVICALTVLGGLAEFERELILMRTAEGRKRSKAAGKHMGRPHKLTGPQRSEALRRKQDGEPLATIALSYGVSKHTISRLKAA
jgi:DNA invertase Pin-like site-specific DNA recombinase